MKDIRDVEISVGDAVAFTYREGKSSELWHGIVIGFTEKMVKIRYSKRQVVDRASNYMPHNVCVVNQTKEL